MVHLYRSRRPLPKYIGTATAVCTVHFFVVEPSGGDICLVCLEGVSAQGVGTRTSMLRNYCSLTNFTNTE